MRAFCLPIFITMLFFCLSSCSPVSELVTVKSIDHVSPDSAITATPPQSTIIILPTPNFKGNLTLEETLQKRRSVRNFNNIPLTLKEVSQLLWATQGITGPSGYRTAPSAGALYPLEVYVVLPEGVYHYLPQEHHMLIQRQGDLRPALHAVALNQNAVLDAPAVFVITAIYERTAIKYGKERSPRYVHLEAGHAAQNLLLQVAALDLGAVPIGAFYDDQVKEVLSLPDDHEPLYLIPVGHAE
jgi:SagB-type dehydrogenase family enzyme